MTTKQNFCYDFIMLLNFGFAIYDFLQKTHLIDEEKIFFHLLQFKRNKQKKYDSLKESDDFYIKTSKIDN